MQYLKSAEITSMTFHQHNNGNQYVYFDSTPFKTEYCKITQIDKEHIILELKDIDIKGIKKLEKTIISRALDNSVEWFGKRLNTTLVNEYFHTKLSSGNNVKFKMSDCLDVYTKANKSFSREDVKEGMYCYAILTIDGIYFSRKEYGIAMKIHQLKVFQSPKLGYIFDELYEPLDI